MYFDGDPLIAKDFEIARAHEELRHLLIAKAKHDDANGLHRSRYDIVLGASG